MARYFVQDTSLTAIADAIRAKTGGTAALTLDGMAEAVAGIQAGGGDDLAAQIIEGTVVELYDATASKVCDYKFYSHYYLTSASLPACTSIGKRAFYDCSALRSVHFPNVTSVGEYAFAATSSSHKGIEEISLPNATFIDQYAFSKAFGLKAADFPKLETLPQYCFYTNQGTMALESVNIPVVTLIKAYAFQNCAKLQSIDLPKCANVYGYAFQNCYSLTSIVLRNESAVCSFANNSLTNCYHFTGTTNSTYNPDGLKDGYIYVPDALVEDYKAATNWSIYASQIKPLSEYVEVTA